MGKTIGQAEAKRTPIGHLLRFSARNASLTVTSVLRLVEVQQYNTGNRLRRNGGFYTIARYGIGR